MDEQITPLAKKLAEENSIDWRFIKGTGPVGKVIERDILHYLSRIMSGELDLPSTPDASEPASPSGAGASMPDLGQVANFEALSANMAKEGVDLNSMLSDFATKPAAMDMSAIPELDFPETPVSVQPAVVATPVPDLNFSVNPTQVDAPIVATTEDDAVFEFEMDDIDEVEVSTVHQIPTSVDQVAPAQQHHLEMNATVPVVSSFDEDQIMDVQDDNDAIVPHDAQKPVHDEISVYISGEFERIPDPLENLPFELDAHNKSEMTQTLIVDDATFPIETDLVVETIQPEILSEPAHGSFGGLDGVGAAVIGGVAAFEHFNTPVVSEVAKLEPEVVVPEVIVPEPMIAHFDPEPVYIAPEPVIAQVIPEPTPIHIEPEPVYIVPEPVYVVPEPVYVAPEPVVAQVIPEPIHVEPAPIHLEPEPTPILQEPIPVVPVIAPLIEPIVSSQAETTTPVSVVHKDFFNTKVLRRQFSAAALNDIRSQISKALNGREVQLAVFVGRAAQRELHYLTSAEGVTLHKLEDQLVPLSTTGLQHSFIEAVQSVNRAEPGEARGLAVLDASELGVDDLILPTNGALLTLGRINDNMGMLTLSGEFSAKAGAEFLASVAQTLETPVGLVL